MSIIFCINPEFVAADHHLNTFFSSLQTFLHLSSHRFSFFPFSRLYHSSVPVSPQSTVDSISDFICLQGEKAPHRRSRPGWWAQEAADRWRAAQARSLLWACIHPEVPNCRPGSRSLTFGRDDGAERWVQPQFALPSAWHGAALTVTLLRVCFLYATSKSEERQANQTVLCFSWLSHSVCCFFFPPSFSFFRYLHCCKPLLRLGG